MFTLIISQLTEVFIIDIQEMQWYDSVDKLRSGEMVSVLHIVFFKCIFLKEKLHNLNKTSLNYAPDGPGHNKSALFQVMTWLWTSLYSAKEVA